MDIMECGAIRRYHKKRGVVACNCSPIYKGEDKYESDRGSDL